MSKLLKNKEVKNILLIFLYWKVASYLLLLLSFLVPLFSKNFLGGGWKNYLDTPWIFAWANFDGEHYLSIAQSGYKGLEQAFFPIYPMLMHALAYPVGINLLSLTIAGLVISNLSFAISLILLFKLVKFDYQSKVATLTLILLLVFPASFYFGAVYSESIFLLFSVTSFYLARKKKWFWASFFGIASSATRVFGFLLLPALLLEAKQQQQNLSKYIWIFAVPLGLIGYMVYQWLNFGDPLLFYKLQKIVGEQHQSGITLLPQVWFRYLKILTSTFFGPLYLTEILEFFVGAFFFILPIYGFYRKIRWSYTFYSMVGFLLPTIQGSFSSLPRYVLILFPTFLSLALLLLSSPRWVRMIYLVFSIIWLCLETMFFLRGYWVA